MKFLSIQIALICLLISCTAHGQSIDDAYNHEILVDQLEKSENTKYAKIVASFEDYLIEHPDDLLIEIEKCKFIELAQYNYYDDWNPNQTQFDSCAAELLIKYPNHPAVLCYHTTFSWGDELDEILDHAEAIMYRNSEWTDEDRAEILFSIGTSFYYDDNFEEASKAMIKASSYNPDYKKELIYARVMKGANKLDEALNSLNLTRDSSEATWTLSQRASLLLELKDYKNALAIYEVIEAKDSTYNDDSELGEVMEGLGQYEAARNYFVNDTTNFWQQKDSKYRLFEHDLSFSTSDSCLTSYNAYRDMGFSADPMALHRLHLMTKHPFQGWKFRDLGGLLLFLLIMVLLVLIPTIWILPVYFIGHKWGNARRNISMKSPWGLKAFWWVSIGFMFATFFAMFTDIEIIHSWVNWEEYVSDVSLAKFILAFILILALFGFLSLFKSGIKLYVAKHVSLGQVLKMVVISFIAFKIGSAIYIPLVVNIFDMDLLEITGVIGPLLASKQDILVMVDAYGNSVTILLIAVLVPVYEELIFRGVILRASQRYLNFKWANIFQAALFGLIHESLFLFPVFFAFGLITGILVKRTGSLFGGILFHIVNNLIIGIFIIMTNDLNRALDLVSP